MALTEATLASALANLAPTTITSDAIDSIAGALRSYFEQGTIRGGTPLALSAGETAAKSAMAGIDVANAGAAKIAAGVAAFWTDFAAAGAGYWATAVIPDAIASIAPPPTVPGSPSSGLEKDLQDAFTASKDGSKNLADSTAAMATAIHSNQGGNVVTITLSVGGTEITAIS